MEKLKDTLNNLAVEAGGHWGIVVEDLHSNDMLEINSNRQFAAKSIIKIPIMAAVFAAYEDQQLSFSDLVTLKQEDMVGGSGVLQHLSPGIQLPVYDLVTLMIIQSDNTATNILVDMIGFNRVQEIMEQIGMEKSCFRKKLMIYPAKENVENFITARDIATLLKKLAAGNILSGYSCERMINILKKQQILNGLPAYLPASDSEVIGVTPKWELANKTGWDVGHQHDVGILYVGEKCFTIVALSEKVQSNVALETLAKIGREVYHYILQK